MKKTFLLALMACTFLTQSCSSEESEPLSVIGAWKVSKQVILSGEDGTVLDTYTPSGCMVDDTIEFKENYTFLNSLYGGTGGTCSLEDLKMGTYNYNPNTNLLGIKYDGDANTKILTVTKLTETEIEAYTYEADHNNDGIDDKFVTYYYR